MLAQWITWLTRDRCNPKVPSSIPAGSKDFPWARKFNHIALCLGGHIKVRVPGATVARKSTCVMITPQYYAPKWALLSINQNQSQNGEHWCNSFWDRRGTFKAPPPAVWNIRDRIGLKYQPPLTVHKLTLIW